MESLTLPLWPLLSAGGAVLMTVVGTVVHTRNYADRKAQEAESRVEARLDRVEARLDRMENKLDRVVDYLLKDN